MFLAVVRPLALLKAPVEDGDDLTPPEVWKSRLRRRRIGAVLLLLIFLAAGLYLAKPGIKRSVTHWHSRRQAAQALGLIERQEWSAALSKSQSAYALAPDEPSAVRAVARVLARTRKRAALPFFRRLAALGPLDIEDRRDFAASALLQNEMVIASQEIEWLLSHAGDTLKPADLLMASQLAAVRGDQVAALPFADRVLTEARASGDEKLTAAVRLVNSSDGNAQSRGWAHVRRLAESRASAGLNALILLSRRLPANVADAGTEATMPAEEIAKGLEAHPLAGVEHRLLALDLRTGPDTAQQTGAVDEAVARFQTGDVAGLAILAKWLHQKGEFGRVVEVIPLSKAGLNAELSQSWLEALASLERWDEIKQALKSDRLPLDPVFQHMYLAVASGKMAEKVAQANEWQRSLEAAQGDANRSYLLGQYAERNDAKDIADAAYAQAIASAAQMRPAYEARLLLAHAQGRTKDALDVVTQMLGLWESDSNLRNQHAYYRLLLGANGPAAEEAEQAAIQLVAREPANWAARAVAVWRG